MSTRKSRAVAIPRVTTNGTKKPPYRLPAGRAWRIVPQKAAAYMEGAPAVTAGVCPPMLSTVRDGIFPVWVRLTDPVTRAVRPDLVHVDGIGWQHIETGPDWRIEVVCQVPVQGGPTPSFAYVVETVESIEEATPIVPGVSVTPTEMADTATGAPVEGLSAVHAVTPAVNVVVTQPDTVLRLTAVGGDVFYAIDAHADQAVDRALLLAGATEYVKAGLRLEYTDGPNAGATLYVAALR